MRAFFSIELPGDIRNSIYENIEKLKKLDLACKFVEMDNLHITLLFLGDVKEEELEERVSLIENEIGKKEGFFVTIEDIGFFYNRRGLVRVIWQDVIKNSKKIEDISKIIYMGFEDILEKNDLLGKHDTFKSHLTIGRAKKINRHQSNELKEWAREYNEKKKKLKFKVDKISLVKSELTPEGPNYTVIKNIKLK